MSLHYATLDRYSLYDPVEPVSSKNPGGGMGAKTLNAVNTWKRFYDVLASEDLDSDASILVVEPLWFRLRSRSGALADELVTPNIQDAIEAYKQHPAKIKVLYTSELALLKIPRSERDEIVSLSSVVTTNCRFQKMLYEMYNITTMPLCDVTDPLAYHHPNTKKRLAVMSMGRISATKNSLKTAAIFEALAGKIERVYFGGASLWGYADSQDSFIESQLVQHCDAFYNNVTDSEVSRGLEGIAIGIFDTFHDCCSTSNLQSLMAGCYDFYGLHGLWAERPGVHNLRTVSDFVDAIEKSTDGFKSLPDLKHRTKAEEWGMKHTSPDCFLRQWEDIVRYARK